MAAVLQPRPPPIQPVKTLLPMKVLVNSGASQWLAWPRATAPCLPVPAIAAPHRRPGFLIIHLWVPLVALLLMAIALMVLHGDQWLADRLYAWQGHHWALRSNFITEKSIHIFGRDLSTAAWLGVLAAWIVTRTRTNLSHWRRPLAYLALSTLLATALVAWVKSWSNMDCPWDLARYGGDRVFVDLFGLRPIGLSRGACFPAGHASAGYAWMALYFFFLTTRPRWRWLGLSVGVGLGALFGFSQQLRGAHFLSHDLWTAAICWLTAFGVHALVWRESGGAQIGSAVSGARHWTTSNDTPSLAAR